MYELRDMVKQRVVGRKDQELALLFQSFGFKHGVPLDSDFVFDVRCLPNPYWDTSLRKYVGTDQPDDRMPQNFGDPSNLALASFYHNDTEGC